MTQEYDKIIKENIEAIFLPLAEKYLGITIASSRKLHPKLQTTLEREPDFIRMIHTESGKSFILHIEFQTTDEEDMVYRMAEYQAILLRKYKLPVRQFVVFLGARVPKMRTDLHEEEVISGFHLTNFHAFRYQTLIQSQIPEEIMLAILSDFGTASPEEVIRLIIHRLQEVSKGKLALEKYIRQLNILSRLRKLEKETIKEIRAMPITYDIKKDFLYQEGKEEGRQEGRQEGKQEGKQEGEQEKERQMIINLLQSQKLTVDEIAQVAGVSVSYVQQIQESINKQQ